MRLNNYRDCKYFAEELVRGAGKILLDYQKRVSIVKYKDLQDIATSADLASEEFIISAIRKKYPDHLIYSEEKGELGGSSDFRWVIDPLDGTKEYLRGIPLFNVSLALEYKGDLMVAALFRPSENVLYSAAKGMGAFKNGVRIYTSSKRKLEESFVYCYLPSFRRQSEKYDEAFDKLKRVGKVAYRLRSLADENTSLCWLAQGGIEAYLNLSNPPKWHDIATGLLIAKEAGAIIKSEDGDTLENGNIQTFIAANNKFIYNEVVEVLKKKA